MSEVIRKSRVAPRNIQSIASEAGRLVNNQEIPALLKEALLGYTKNPNIIAAGLNIYHAPIMPNWRLLELTSFYNFASEAKISFQQTDINNPLYGYKEEVDGHQIFSTTTNIRSTNDWLPRQWGYKASQERYLNDPEYQAKYLRKLFFNYGSYADCDDIEHLAQFFVRIKH